MKIVQLLPELNEGGVEQTGTPSEIYNFPRTRFVASFIGTLNQVNATVADVQAGAGGVGEHVQDVVLRLAAGDRLGAEGRVGFPDGLPLLLEGGEIVAAGFCFRSVHECVQIGGSGRRWQGFGASAGPIPLA